MKIERIFFTTLFILAILSIATAPLVLNTTYYDYLSAKYGTNEDHARTNDQVVEYLIYETALPEAMSAREITHMADVRTLMISILAILLTSLLGGLYRLENPASLRELKTASTIILGSTLILAIIPFESLFSTFHTSLFAAGSWLFSADTLLIQTYPAQFFSTMFSTILLGAALTSAIVLLTTAIFNHNKS